MSQQTVRSLRMADQMEFASAIADRRAAANKASFRSIVAMLLTVVMIVVCGGVLKGAYSNAKGRPVATNAR